MYSKNANPCPKTLQIGRLCASQPLNTKALSFVLSPAKEELAASFAYGALNQESLAYLQPEWFDSKC